MAYPSDLMFYATDERLVGYYLRNRVNTGKDDFITDIELYEDEPWLLPHVNNNLFKEKRWFYFVVRTRRSGNRPNRTVPGRGGSNGGTWTATGVKKKIIDSNTKAEIGYRTELAYHKIVKGKPKGDTTGWVMTEYWLASQNDAQFQEVVLCHLRDKSKKVNKIAVEKLPESKNGDKNIVLEQPEQESSEDNNIMVSNALVSGGEGGKLNSEFGLQNNNMFGNDEILGLTHQRQPLIPPPQDMMIPPLQGQVSRFPVATQEQQYRQISLPQRQDSGSISNRLVTMEDECINQDEAFALADQEAGIFQPKQQQEMMMAPYTCLPQSTSLDMQNSMFYSQDSLDQDISKSNNMTNNSSGLIYNTRGCEIQGQPVTNGVTQDSYYSALCSFDETMFLDAT